MGVKGKVSVIIPYVREWPQIVFTLRSIREVLKGENFEVIAVDNLQPNMQEDRSTPNVKGMANAWKDSGDQWIKYFHYPDKLSHWQCKNFAMKQADGEFFWFIDGHCIMPTDAVDALHFYRQRWKEMNGSLHMPLTYHIMEPRQLIYKAVIDSDKGDYHYKFHTLVRREYSNNGQCIEVPAMSTCGMLIHKKFMRLLGNWPTELGIYGGGENFINYAMAVLGMKKYVYLSDSLCHHGEKRGYSWNHYDQQRNRSIASYMFGGASLLDKFLDRTARLTHREKTTVRRSIIDTCGSHREWIKKHQVMSIEEWHKQWKPHELCIGV